MQSIFRYPGGKTRSKIRDWIIGNRPATVGEYREPFVGGGGIFFAFRSDIPRWINDKHCGLIEVYTALRDRPEAFIKRCRDVAPARDDDPLTESGPRGGQPTNARLKAIFDSVCLNEKVDQAFRYYFVNRTVHGSGRVNYDIPSRLYFSNPDGWNITAGKILEQAAEHIAGTKITCGDYAELFDADGENVWIYADPPYVVNTNLTRTSQIYQHSFTHEDHERFAETVARCKHNVCISYDDDDEGVVRSLFPKDSFRLIEASWKYCGTTSKEKEDGRELLILNYDPPITTGAVAVPESFQIVSVLTDEEEQLLTECEQSIERHFKSFVEVGKALKTIRDSGLPSQRLYRKYGFDTFDAYCDKRWGFTENYANKMIRGFARIEALKIGTIVPVLPEREAHIRELCRIETDEQAAEVWAAVVESVEDPKEITAKLIREHVNEAIGYEPPERDPVEAIVKAIMKLTEDQRAIVLKRVFPVTEAV